MVWEQPVNEIIMHGAAQLIFGNLDQLADDQMGKTLWEALETVDMIRQLVFATNNLSKQKSSLLADQYESPEPTRYWLYNRYFRNNGYFCCNAGLKAALSLKIISWIVC
ncbi:hypothetical protein CS542_06110 [Pedobacter sp. IW39]|nr:hypothetical protein CS542_06110 [Pedobacter sp. IW39]